MKAARHTSRTLLGTRTTNCCSASGTAKLSDWPGGSEGAGPETQMLIGSRKQTSARRVTPVARERSADAACRAQRGQRRAASPGLSVADSSTFCRVGPVLFSPFRITVSSRSKPRSRILEARGPVRPEPPGLDPATRSDPPVCLVQNQPAHGAERQAERVLDVIGQPARRRHHHVHPLTDPGDQNQQNHQNLGPAGTDPLTARTSRRF